MGNNPLRKDGFAPIGGYGVIGDGRSVALSAADGAIDWWAVPEMDAPPVFAGLLDPQTGGSLMLTPAVPYQAQRRYLPDTNVLETTFYAGSDDLDASVLLAGRMGFVPGDSPRFSQTIDAVRDELADGPLIYRYTGSREQEGAFLACSFWLIDALVRAGRHEQAREMWKGMTPYAGDLGLLSEEFDPASGELRGNLPQALSHLALLMAAHQLAGSQGPHEGP